MKAELKDVLHFYLGCECLADVPDIKLPQRLKLDYMLLLNQDFFKNPKPILRPLSDITEYEAMELVRAYTGINPVSIVFSMGQIIFTYHEIDEIKNGCIEIQYGNADCFLFLLSKHFDLFNLIPSGQAIDATTLTPAITSN